MTSINSKAFYSEYHGHPINMLEDLIQFFRSEEGGRSICWLAGDSSLDSKFWFAETAPACNGFERLLTPPTMKQDAAYWLNLLIEERGAGAQLQAAINCAVEESTMAERSSGPLAHDQVIARHIDTGDVLVLSLGGNDIALRPSFKTIVNMLLLSNLHSADAIGSREPGSLWGMTHFVNLFKDGLERVIQQMTAQKRPKAVIVCSIYFPDEAKSGGWADRVLGYLKYYSDPARLQASIRAIHREAICKVAVDGVRIIPFALSDVLDGKTPGDYCAGVEPSAQGNQKIANALMSIIDGL